MQYENRSFAADVLACIHCGGRLRILASAPRKSRAGFWITSEFPHARLRWRRQSSSNFPSPSNDHGQLKLRVGVSLLLRRALPTALIFTRLRKSCSRPGQLSPQVNITGSIFRRAPRRTLSKWETRCGQPRRLSKNAPCYTTVPRPLVRFHDAPIVTGSRLFRLCFPMIIELAEFVWIHSQFAGHLNFGMGQTVPLPRINPRLHSVIELSCVFHHFIYSTLKDRPS